MNPTQPIVPATIVDLHGLKLAFQSPDAALGKRFEEVYGHLVSGQWSVVSGQWSVVSGQWSVVSGQSLGHPEGVLPGVGGHLSSSGDADNSVTPDTGTLDTGTPDTIFIGWHIHKLPSAPPPPPGMPLLVEGKLVSYYGQGQLVAVRLPKYGLITIDLEQRRVIGAVTRTCLEAYGAFEDVLMIALAPLYRRRGWFPLHAFAARSPQGRVALISGEMGSGKTTTGLALLNAGWKLLSNDSPLLRRQSGQVEVLAYPGRLSAFDDSLVRFESLRRFIPGVGARPASFPIDSKAEVKGMDLLASDGPPKRVFRAEEAFVEPWAESGVAGAVFFPQVTPGLEQTELVKVESKEALLALMPQGVEGWDKAMIGPAMHLLSQLVEQVPCYRLRLSPRVEQLPEVIGGGMSL